MTFPSLKFPHSRRSASGAFCSACILVLQVLFLPASYTKALTVVTHNLSAFTARDMPMGTESWLVKEVHKDRKERIRKALGGVVGTVSEKRSETTCSDTTGVGETNHTVQSACLIENEISLSNSIAFNIGQTNAEEKAIAEKADIVEEELLTKKFGIPKPTRRSVENLVEFMKKSNRNIDLIAVQEANVIAIWVILEECFEEIKMADEKMNSSSDKILLLNHHAHTCIASFFQDEDTNDKAFEKEVDYAAHILLDIFSTSENWPRSFGATPVYENLNDEYKAFIGFLNSDKRTFFGKQNSSKKLADKTIQNPPEGNKKRKQKYKYENHDRLLWNLHKRQRKQDPSFSNFERRKAAAMAQNSGQEGIFSDSLKYPPGTLQRLRCSVENFPRAPEESTSALAPTDATHGPFGCSCENRFGASGVRGSCAVLVMSFMAAVARFVDWPNVKRTKLIFFVFSSKNQTFSVRLDPLKTKLFSFVFERKNDTFLSSFFAKKIISRIFYIFY